MAYLQLEPGYPNAWYSKEANVMVLFWLKPQMKCPVKPYVFNNQKEKMTY